MRKEGFYQLFGWREGGGADDALVKEGGRRVVGGGMSKNDGSVTFRHPKDGDEDDAKELVNS